MLATLVTFRRHSCIFNYSFLLSPEMRTKKSSCVKEVEKIKQRRAERRAAQLAMREQQEHQFDASAPSWEFEAMIR
jgi:hypothetical protein